MLRATPWVLVCLCVCGVMEAGATNPGLQLQLSQSGLNYVATVTIDVLSTKVRGQNLPDQHGSDRLSVGKVDYDITGMRVTSFTKPSSNVVVNPGSGLTLTAAGAGAQIHGNWAYKYRLGFIKFRDHGSFDISVSGVTISLSVTLGVDSGGRPTIRSTGCRCDVGSVRVKFHGGKSWLYNLFDHKVAGIIKDKMRDMMCKAANDAINTNAAQELSTLPVLAKLGDIMDLDYRLVSPPAFGNNFIESRHKGEVFWRGDQTEAPFSPHPFAPSPGTKNKMIEVVASDYILNSMGFALQKHGFIKYNLTAKDLPPGSRGRLNTTCTSFGCFGDIFPQVAARYPNRSVSISMATSEPPTLDAVPGKLNGNFVGKIAFYATTLDGRTSDYMFTTNTTVTFAISAGINNNHVTAKVDSFKANLVVIDTKVGPVAGPVLNFLINTIVNTFVIPKLNERGAEGIPLPNMDGVQFVNPDIQIVQDAIVISSDVKYHGKSSTLYFKSAD